ncbi:MAM domain-containing glycosylphosphatidylinositol anchor protein 1, partial [Stylophora pistillata]
MVKTEMPYVLQSSDVFYCELSVFGWNEARLISPYIGLKVACLKFWYHSYGDDAHMGQLQLIIKSDTGEKLVWSVNRDRGDIWVWRHATIVSKQPYRKRLWTFRGLWCIDDVPFRNKIPYLKKLPGQIYSIDEQCQHEFGPNTRYCNG